MADRPHNRRTGQDHDRGFRLFLISLSVLSSIALFVIIIISLAARL